MKDTRTFNALRFCGGKRRCNIILSLVMMFGNIPGNMQAADHLCHQQQTLGQSHRKLSQIPPEPSSVHAKKSTTTSFLGYMCHIENLYIYIYIYIYTSYGVWSTSAATKHTPHFLHA